MDFSTLHYRCSFDIQSVDTTNITIDCLWYNVIKTVRSWLESRVSPEDDDFWKGWFYQGGIWRHTTKNGISIKTGRVIGLGSESSPQYWALSYRIPCGECNQRTWKTSIGITILNANRLRFNMQVGHEMKAHFLGELPAAPSSSAPAILKRLLGSNMWRCEIGNSCLLKKPVKVTLGEAQELAANIRSQERSCPVVVVSKSLAEEKTLIDASVLQALVGGVANVYVLDSVGAEEEFDYYVGDDYRCNGGMVRIYLPGVDPSNPFDQRRHRFFFPAQIQDIGAENVTNMVVRMLCRYTPQKMGESIYAIEDLSAVERSMRLLELRRRMAAAPNTDQSELFELYEKEIAELSEKLSQSESQKEDSQLNLIEKEDDFAHMVREKNAAINREKDAHNKVNALSAKLSILENFECLPSSLADVLRKIGIIHSNTIIVTERAIKSATEYKNYSDIAQAWSCMWAISTDLHALHFDKTTLDIEREFKAIKGFELSLKEGRQTNRNSDLMKLRKLEHNGDVYDITPHVKAGGNKEPKCLRVYYAPDSNSRKIIIGHCGAHLDNATTGKLH